MAEWTNNLTVALILIVGGVQFTVGLALGAVLAQRGRRRRDDSDRLDEQSSQEVQQAIARLYNISRKLTGDLDAYRGDITSVEDDLETARRDCDIESGRLDEAVIVKLLTGISEANTRLHERLRATEQQLDQQASLLEAHVAEAHADALTGLGNRRVLDEELHKRLSEWERLGHPFSVMIVDADDFKAINDTHGHLAGDKTLKQLAGVFRQCVRPMDVVTRFGGEEFAVLLPSSDRLAAIPVVERLRLTVQEMIMEYEGRQFGLTVSVGLASSSVGDRPAAILDRADKALYAAKHAGKNRGYMHTGDAIEPVSLDDSELRDPPVVTEDEHDGLSLHEKLEESCVDLRRAVLSQSGMADELESSDRS